MSITKAAQRRWFAVSMFAIGLLAGANLILLATRYDFRPDRATHQPPPAMPAESIPSVCQPYHQLMVKVDGYGAALSLLEGAAPEDVLESVSFLLAGEFYDAARKLEVCRKLAPRPQGQGLHL